MKELDEFGKIFISEVRDRSIEDVDMSISGTYRSKRAIELTQQFSSLDKNSKEFIKRIIPFAIDYCLNNFLEMFEEHEELLLGMEGKDLCKISDGLSGELYTEDGWIQKYTTQRYEEN
jgi:hypothetical protein